MPRQLTLREITLTKMYSTNTHYCQNFKVLPRVILASKLFIIIFIGLCGPVGLCLVHSNVTHLVGLSVDCIVYCRYSRPINIGL